MTKTSLTVVSTHLPSYLSPKKLLKFKNAINWVVYKKQTFLTVLETESPRSSHQQIWYLVGAFFLLRREKSFHCVLAWKERLANSVGSLL